MNDTTTKAARPADIREAQLPLANAAAILETLTRNPSDTDAELSMTLQVVLRELYDGMERCQQLDIDTRKAQAAPAPADTSTDAHPDSAASVAADAVAKINRLPAKQREAVIAVMKSIDPDDAPADTSTAAATEQDEDEDEAAMLARLDARNRSNQFFTDNTGDTLHRVAGGLALLSRVDDSEDHDPDADTGKLYLIESMRCALDAETARISKLHEAARLSMKAAS